MCFVFMKARPGVTHLIVPTIRDCMVALLCLYLLFLMFYSTSLYKKTDCHKIWVNGSMACT